jgi:hypothetical protein
MATRAVVRTVMDRLKPDRPIPDVSVGRTPYTSSHGTLFENSARASGVGL